VVGREDPDFDRSPAELEVEYEDRARKIRAPFGKGYLDLARWCVGTDLTNHLTYLLERVRATESQEGAVLAKLLVDAYGEASAWDKDEIAKVLFRHYPHNTAVRAIRRARLGLPEPAVASSKPPRPLIGAGEGTSRKDRPRREPLTEDFLARVDLAKQHARKGREHYDRAQPDMPDRAKHRKLALIELRKARDIYDKLLEERDEAWLRSRLQDVYQMLYWMRKDQPAK